MQDKQKFYETQWFMWVLLIFFYPLGVILLWVNKFYHVGLRAFLSIFFGIVFLVAITPTEDAPINETGIVENETNKKLEETEEVEVDAKKPEITAEEKAKLDAEAKKKEEEEIAAKKIADEKRLAEEKAKKEAEEKAKIEKEEQVKESILLFEKEMLETEKPFTAYSDEYQRVMNAASNGNGDLITLYATIKKAHELAYSVNSSYLDLEIPVNIPEEDKKILEEAKETMATAYYLKTEAFDKMMRFIDEQKPSLMVEAEEDLKNSNLLLLSAISKLFEVKSKYGLEL